MKPGHLLFLTGMNRETFNTLQRRGHLSFLDLHTGDNGEGDQSVDRFRPWHALGLKAFGMLRAIGVSPDAAHTSVHDSWPDIIRVAGLLNEEPRSTLCGIRMNDIGVMDTWGWPHPKSKGGKPIATSHVDLTELWADLAKQIKQLKA